MPIYSPSREKIKYLFIDGGCLSSLLTMFSEKLFGGVQVEIDYNLLADGYQKVFYYDCLPALKPEESDSDYQQRIRPQIDLFNRLKAVDRFHVYEGTARYRDKRRGQEQKQVDIMITVDMLTHASQRNMQEATLLTGDLDFKPLIDALVQQGMYVSLWYPKGKTNYELVDAADSRQVLKIDIVQRWFTQSFRAKAVLPEESQPQILNLAASWQQLNELDLANGKAFLYQNQGNFAAVIPKPEKDYYFYQHNNLDQLKFYLEHIHNPNVLRP